MSYELILYKKGFLEQAVEKFNRDWSDSEPIPTVLLDKVTETLYSLDYLLENEDAWCVEYVKKVENCPIYVTIQETEISFSVPYEDFDNSNTALDLAIEDSRKVAQICSLGFYNPQEGEAEFFDNEPLA